MKSIHTKKTIRIGALLLSFVFLVSSAKPAYATKKVDELEKETSGLESELSNLGDELKALDKELNQITKQVKSTSSELKKIRNEHKISDLSIIIGSEGGFSSEEAVLVSNSEIYTVGLGKRILRAETAAVFALSCIVYEFELA